MRTTHGSASHLNCLTLALTTLVAVGLAGCETPSKRLNAPPQGHTEHPSKLQANYTPMTDNAMLADMNMSSIHFVPHQSELNATGVRRLQRYAEILRIYGGTLCYDGVRDDKALADGRLKRIEDFLASAGLDQSQFKIERGLAGGAGMNAGEATEIRAGTSYTASSGESSGSSPGAALKELVTGKSDKKN